MISNLNLVAVSFMPAELFCMLSASDMITSVSVSTDAMLKDLDSAKPSNMLEQRVRSQGRVWETNH